MKRLRVLAVHHNRILRDGISVLLEMDRDFELVDSVATADAAVAVFAATHPDLVCPTDEATGLVANGALTQAMKLL